MRPIFTLFFLAPAAFAQRALPEYRNVEYALHSGPHAGPALGTASDPTLVFETTIETSNATWIRLRFADAELGARSQLLVTSHANGDYQLLDSVSLDQWKLTTGAFRGHAVTLQLYAGAGDQGVFIEVESLDVGPPPSDTPGDPTGGIDTLCGSDNRGPSSDNRVGRLFFGGCSAWRITNGAFLTAGHCIDLDPDQGGPMLPDGTPDLSGFIEFNVPASNADGSTNPAALDDQYAIDTGSFVWNFDGLAGLGKDWGLFAVFPNSNTGLLPHDVYGLPLRVSSTFPSTGATMRITGFGGDSSPAGSGGGGNAQNFTNQTSSGPYSHFTVPGSGEVAHHYRVDTAGGNSGSPILVAGTDYAVGIHTNGGCTLFGGNNSGTAFLSSAPYDAINEFKGANVRYVDAGHPFTSSGGTAFGPYASFVQGTSLVPTGGLLSVVAGSYPVGSPLVITRAMTLEAPTGSAVIGN